MLTAFATHTARCLVMLDVMWLVVLAVASLTHIVLDVLLAVSLLLFTLTTAVVSSRTRASPSYSLTLYVTLRLRTLATRTLLVH